MNMREQSEKKVNQEDLKSEYSMQVLETAVQLKRAALTLSRAVGKSVDQVLNDFAEAVDSLPVNKEE